MPTDDEKVRLFSGLTATELPDDQIATWLDLAGGSPRLAAAEALEAFAVTLIDTASDDITLSGSKRAATILARASSLRAQAEAAGEGPADDGFAFDVVYPGACRPELTERDLS